MKKGILVLLVALGLAGVAHAGKIGFVDLDRILSQSRQGKRAKAQFDKIAKPKQREIEKKQDALKKKVEDFQRKQALLSPSGKIEEQKKLQMEMMQVQQISQKYLQEMQLREKKLLEPLVRKVKKIIEEISAKEDYSLVIEKKAPFIIYMSDKRDLTKRVLKKLK